MSGDIVKQLLATGLFNGFNRPVDRQSKGILLPEILLEKHMDELIGGILHHPDFLNDHALLAVYFRRVKNRLEKKIRKKIGQQWKM